MKRIGAIFVIAILIFGLSGCNIQSSNPEKSVNKFFKGLTAGDKTKVEEVTSSSENLSQFLPEDDYSSKMIKLILSKLDYKINSSKITGDKATVTVNVTALDYKNLIEKLVSDWQASDVSGMDEDAQKKYSLDYLKKQLSDPKVKLYTTKNLKMELKKVDGTWMVQVTDDLITALLGGYDISTGGSSATQ